MKSGIEVIVSAKKLPSHSPVHPFRLSDAVRPALHRPVMPRQGYRRDEFCDDELGIRVPVLAAAVSCEHLFDLFLDLLEPFGDTVDVILETSHGSASNRHEDRLREDIDRPVLLSHLCGFEDLLVNDGCTGVAVICKDGPMEVQFDEHKLLVVYAPNLAPFEAIFQRYGIRRDDSLKLIAEGEHLHHTEERFAEQFDQLCCCLGIGEPAESLSW